MVNGSENPEEVISIGEVQLRALRHEAANPNQLTEADVKASLIAEL